MDIELGDAILKQVYGFIDLGGTISSNQGCKINTLMNAITR